MSAYTCAVARIEEKTREFQSPNLFARGVKPLPERRCPHCDSIVYSRRNKQCGVCSGLLPAACLFTEEQADRVSILLREERQRHRAWLHRVNFGQ